jgi:predicted ATPase
MGKAPVSHFGEMLKRLRLDSGLSQEGLAERARMSVSAIGALERGERRAPYRDTVALLATGLGLSGTDRAELEAAALRGRGRRPRADAVPAARNNLPARLSSFVGRDEEIAEITALTQTRRLITVTGSGGVGKTRTVTEVARRLLLERRDEVWFVDLSPISDGAFAVSAIAAVLEVSLSPDMNAVANLTGPLQARTLLLILDNCEHVIEEAAEIAGAILRTCPGITILATSRERLDIEGEQVYRLPSMAVPAKDPVSAEEALRCTSFRLFIERGTAADFHLELTAERVRTGSEICRRLEGIPLAIELAASRLPAFGFAALNEHLKEHFVFSGGPRDRPQRQRTMLAAVAWSYDLLSEPERVLLRRLAMFRGGVTVEAAETVCADATLSSGSISDLLPALVEKSLLTMNSAADRRRYGMLESVRAFASSKLTEADEFARTARAHAGWMATLADRGHERRQEVPSGPWLAEFAPELDDVRAALEWCSRSDTDENVLLASRIVGGLRSLWLVASRRVECRGWIEPLVDRLDETRYPIVAARLMAAHIQSASNTDVFVIAERAIPFFERIDDRLSLMSLHAHMGREFARIGAFEKAEHAIALAFALAHEERAQRSHRYADMLSQRAGIRLLAGRYDEALADIDEAERLRSAIGGGENVRNLDLFRRAAIEFRRGNYQRSVEAYEACVDHERRQGGHPASALHQLAAARLAAGDIDGAESAARESLEQAGGMLELVWPAIWQLAPPLALRREPILAARLFGFAAAVSEQIASIPEVIELSSYDILMTSLNEQLSPDTIIALQAEGARFDLERAVAAVREMLPR